MNGYLLTGRDQAHKLLSEGLKQGKRLPVSLKGQTIYYVGPTPARPGRAIGACGPTTSSRMDAFTPTLLKNGLKGMMGKGRRSEEVRRAIKRERGVYFITFGGAAAYLSTKVVEAKAVAYKYLGPEAIYKLKVKDFPAIVAIDSKGDSVL